MKTDLSKTKNKSLAGTDLSYASFFLSDLSGINLSDVTLKTTNFWKADLSGLDFTVTTNTAYQGTIFRQADLSNSNFEGVTLSPVQVFGGHTKNDVQLKQAFDNGDLSSMDFVFSLFGKGYSKDMGFLGYPNIHVVSTEVRENDIIVNFVFFNNFSGANLENANFKNADLWFVDFYSANLTNANLSGADLRKALLDKANLQGADLTGANLAGANLSGANLAGANLSGANYDEDTILKCVGHPICVN